MQKAEELLAGYIEHWGEGKKFDITVVSKTDDLPTMLLTAMNHADKMDNSEKRQLFDGLDIVSLHFKQHTHSKEVFNSAARSILPELHNAVQSHRTQDALLLLEALSELVLTGEVRKREA